MPDALLQTEHVAIGFTLGHVIPVINDAMINRLPGQFIFVEDNTLGGRDFYFACFGDHVVAGTHPIRATNDAVLCDLAGSDSIVTQSPGV